MKRLYIVVRITKATGDRVDVAIRKTKKAAENRIYGELCYDRRRNLFGKFDYEIREEIPLNPTASTNENT